MRDYALVSLDSAEAPSDERVVVLPDAGPKPRGSRKYAAVGHNHFSPRRVTQFFKDCWQEALFDIQTTGWLRFGFWVLALVWALGLLFSLLLFTIRSAFPIFDLQYPKACTQDGSFGLHPYRYSIWSQPSFFQINLGFGEFSFPVAKAIDIIWDIVVGRLGQALLAFISWCSFAAYLTASMEIAPVTFRTFTTIFTASNPNGLGIFRLIRDFSTKRRLPSRIAMVFIVFSMAFILVFPTFASAMSGYQQNTKAFIRDDSTDQLVPFSSFRPVGFVIHDGDRVNLTKDYVLPSLPERDCDPVLEYFTCFRSFFSLCSSSRRYWYSIEDNDIELCSTIYNVTNYFNKYISLVGPDPVNETSLFPNQTILAPILDIVPTYWGAETISSIINNYEERGMLWVGPDNGTYRYDQIMKRGTCQPEESYRWGFSYLQLLLMITFLLIWTIGTYSMWLTAHLALKDRGRSNEVVGEYKAAVQLARAIEKELKEDPLNLTESQLEKIIKKQLNGGTIEYESQIPPYQQHLGLWRRFWRWIKKTYLWFTALVLFFVAYVGSFLFYIYLIIWMASLFMGGVLAVAHGTTWKSRIMICFCVSFVGAVLDIAIFLPVIFTGVGSLYPYF